MNKYLIIVIRDLDDGHHIVDYFSDSIRFKDWINFHDGLIDIVDLHIFIGSCEFQKVFDGMDYDFIEQVDKFLDYSLEDVSRETV